MKFKVHIALALIVTAIALSSCTKDSSLQEADNFQLEQEGKIRNGGSGVGD